MTDVAGVESVVQLPERMRESGCNHEPIYHVNDWRYAKPRQIAIGVVSLLGIIAMIGSLGLSKQIITGATAASRLLDVVRQMVASIRKQTVYAATIQTPSRCLPESDLTCGASVSVDRVRLYR